MAHCLFRIRPSAFPRVSPTLQLLRYRHSGAALREKAPVPRPQKNMQVASKAGGAGGKGDIGLLTDTFIMPTGANLPSLFKNPGVRLALIKTRIKQRILDLRDMVVFRFATKHKLHIFEPKKVAPSLHRDMYTAFAEGDLDTLRLICGEGLFSSFQRRIATRGTTKMEWKLHRMLSRPKVVSSKAHHYMGLGINRRQAVVRIHSLQSLTKSTPKGKLVAVSDEPKEIVEYLVLEKKYEMGKESPWYIWGTTEETTMERLIELRRKKAEMLLAYQ